MQETTNYQLKKIEGADSPPDITVMNPNWDTIDGQMKSGADHRGNADIHFSAAERSKLATIAEGANHYVHPASHEAGMIAQTSSCRFVSDTEKEVWTSKAEGDHDHDDAYVGKFRSIYTETGNVWLSFPLCEYLLCFENTTDSTVTIPHSSMVDFPIGTEVELYRMNTGKVTITPTMNVTLLSRGNLRIISPCYGYGKLRKIATDTWILFGDLASV